MTLQNMFGVVLWSDTAAQKAVIWCEDQGELAFYTPNQNTIHEAPALDAGDLIQFDVTVQKNMRRASNPQLLEQSHSPNLPQSLRDTRDGDESLRVNTERDDTNKVVSISDYLAPLLRDRVAIFS